MKWFASLVPEMQLSEDGYNVILKNGDCRPELSIFFKEIKAEFQLWDGRDDPAARLRMWHDLQ